MAQWIDNRVIYFGPKSILPKNKENPPVYTYAIVSLFNNNIFLDTFGRRT